MRHLIPFLVLTALALPSAQAAPSQPSPFSNKAFGDGGGYKHPDAEVGQFFETKPDGKIEGQPDPRPATAPKPQPQAPAKLSPERLPLPAAVSRPRPRPFAPAAKADTQGLSRTETASVNPPSPPAASFAGAEDAALDSASEDARRDYEARLFGAAPEPRRPRLDDRQQPALAESDDNSPMGEGMLFVSLELDAQEAGALRDAVAGLGSVAAFRPDARFQPRPAAGGAVRISGWIPASRLGDAIARPGVRRVEVERGARPSGDARITGDYLVTVRVGDVSRSEESIASSVAELTAKAGFKLERVLGIETAPSGGATALVSGTLPVSLLGRALALPGVIKVASAVPAPQAVLADSAAPVKKAGFLQFVMERSLWLILLTILLALPTMGGAVKKGLSVFVPYR
ncbi:MAG: hypothetical protein Q8T11_04370 [Elusimicrobiota bacterium]|nr:hypothetical protein [Elusimicrobiota bacterium]